MSKIPLWDVIVFNVITFSLVILSTYRWKLPLRKNKMESLKELGYNFVFGVPSGYRNSNKQKVPIFYPILTPAPTVDV